MQVRVTENTEEFGKCGCGRSPTGKCVGWHGLSDQEWVEGKTQLIHNLMSGFGKVVTNEGPEDEVV